MKSKGICFVGALVALLACVQPGKVSYSGQTRPPAAAAASVGYLPEIPPGAEKLGVLRVFCGGGAPCDGPALQDQIAAKVAEVGGTHLSHADCQSEHHSYPQKEPGFDHKPPPPECNRVEEMLDLITLVGTGKLAFRCASRGGPRPREVYVITCTANVVRVGEQPAP